MNNKVESSARDISQIISFLPVFMGCINFLVLCILNPWVLKMISPDGILEIETIHGIRKAQYLIVGIGFVLIFFGLLAFKYQWLQFLGKKNNSANIVIFIFMVLWVFVLVEGALRVFPPGKDFNSIVKYEPSAFTRYKVATFDQDVFNEKGEKHFIIRKGYRGESFPLRKPIGEIRIVVLGGSFVFNLSSPQGLDWPHRVGKFLNENGFPSVNVINAGVPGCDSSDSVARLMSEIHLLDPDYVILCHTWNDLKYFPWVTPETPLPQVVQPMLSPNYSMSLLDKITKKSQIYVRAKSIYMNKKYTREGKITESEKTQDKYTLWALQQFKLNLSNFVDVCRNIGAEPILFTQPRLVFPGNVEEDKKRIDYRILGLSHGVLCDVFEDCDRVILEVAKEKEAAFFDAESLLTGGRKDFSDHVHLSFRGAKKMARFTAEYLADLLQQREQSK